MEEIVNRKSSAKELPGTRLSVEKQIAMLKAFVIFCDKNNKGATYKDIAPIIEASPTNVSDSLKFWKSLNILESDGNACKPSKQLDDAIRKIEWGDEENGWEIFRQALKESWFLSHLMMAFRLKPSMTESDLIDSLGSAFGAPNRLETIKPLKYLLQILEISKTVLETDGNLTLNSNIKLSGETETLFVNDEKDLLQVKIGNELYAIDVSLLKNFVIKTGKRLDDKLHHF